MRYPLPSMMRALYSLVFTLVLAFPAHALPLDSRAAPILVYTQVGEDAYPSTNIRLEQFYAHVKELASGEYTVVTLKEVVDAFKNMENLPPQSVAITFDGGYKSVLYNAIPLLEENDIPYAVFVSPGRADMDSPHYLDWDDVRKIARSKNATIGLHPASYARIYEDGDEAIRREINNAKARFRDELGFEPDFFAYPFGEYDMPYRSAIEEYGFSAAFGQQSAVAYAGADLFSLPRFSMTEAYGSLERFRMTTTALPFPVHDIEPTNPRVATNPPSVGFTLDPAIAGKAHRISCFTSGAGNPDMQRIDNRVELRFDEPFGQSRVRVNCTIPAEPQKLEDAPRWRWFGMLLTVPDVVIPEDSEEDLPAD